MRILNSQNKSDKRCLSLIRNQSGFSLTDLVASLPLTGLVFIILVISIVNFGRAYEEVKLYTQLQNELFDAVETMRYGLAKDNVTDNEALIGILAARKVTINPARTQLDIKPLRMTGGLTDDDYKARFWLTDKGELKGWSQYGVKSTGTINVFPSGNNTIGGENRFKMTELEFYPKIIDDDGNIQIVGIKVEAQVRFRGRSEGETEEDDNERNVKTIDYETFVLVGNAGD